MTQAVLRLSEQALRSADQAIGFLMQQAVENADCISLAAGLVDEQSLPVDLVRETVGQVLQDAAAGRKLLQYGTTQGPEPLRRIFRDYLAELEQRIAEAVIVERERSGPYGGLDDFSKRVAVSLDQLRLLIRIGAFRFTKR